MVCKAVLSFQRDHTSLATIIKPAFVFQNSTPYSVAVAPCITEKGADVCLMQQRCGRHELTGEIEPGRCEPLLFWNLLSMGSLSPSKGVVHSLLVTGCRLHGDGEGCALNGKPPSLSSSSSPEMESWSIHLSTDFVRRSFSLPISHPLGSAQSFAPCLLTMHESDDVTYLVLQEDVAPRIIIQNLTAAHFQVAELNGSMGPRHNGGINTCAQVVPSGCEVVYEPPSLAKLYPVVFDEDIATERDRRMQQMAKNVKIRLRRCKSSNHSDNEADGQRSRTVVSGAPSENTSSKDGSLERGDAHRTRRKISTDSCRVFEGWSEPFLVTQSHDTDLQVAGFGSLLVSTDTSSHGTFISLLPGSPSNPCQQLTSRLGGVASGGVGTVSRVLKCELRVDQVVVSLCDDTQSPGSVAEVLRVIANGLCFSHCSLARDGATLDLTLDSLRVDNMMKRSFEDFAVAFLPRQEHAAPQQLVTRKPPPFLSLQVCYNPHCHFQISSVHLSIQSATVQLEDRLLQKLRHVAATFLQPGVVQSGREVALERFDDFSTVPVLVLHESERDARPVTISSLVVEPVSIFVSANITLKAYLSCKDTPFSFSRYELVGVFSNWPEVSQMVAARYVSAVFMHIGWVLGSLELIGSPVSLIQSVNRGLMDLVRLPYEGLTRSPGLFIVGIGQGTASFVRQCSSGALTSVTNLASSIARNMERLSMDPDHVTYQDRQRREHPSLHFLDGVTSGVSSFGLSLISAVAGLVNQPMQSFQQMEESDGTATALLKGVGKGLIGVVTKPVGGAMDLVSKAGQGIMHGTGLSRKLEHCLLPEEMERFVRPQDRRELAKTCGGCSR